MVYLDKVCSTAARQSGRLNLLCLTTRYYLRRTVSSPSDIQQIEAPQPPSIATFDLLRTSKLNYFLTVLHSYLLSIYELFHILLACGHSLVAYGSV